jgi:putative hydrolase of the HAD superfamily
MVCRAVIFDLFGTLVNNLGGEFVQLLRDSGVLAELVGDKGPGFERLWSSPECIRLRAMGIHKTAQEAIAYICQRLDRVPDPASVERAVAIRWDYYRRSLSPRATVLATLEELKRRGILRGLLTVCTTELPAVWAQTSLAPHFEATVFSSEVGMLKPDPRLYKMVCNALGVGAGDCLYVGDGDGRELTGAVGVGMRAVLMCDPREVDVVMSRDEAQEWTGPRISRIEQVLEFVG